jgi:hypothetical protein
LFLAMGAYECRVFLDFHEVVDDQWHSYRRLYEYLGQRGVPSIQQALQELLLQPVLSPFRQIVNPGYFRYLLDARLLDADARLPDGLLDEARQKVSHLIDGVDYLTGSSENRAQILQNVHTGLRLALSLPSFELRYALPNTKRYARALLALVLPAEGERDWVLLLGWLFTRELGCLRPGNRNEDQTIAWLFEWQFTRILQETGRALGLDGPAVDEIGRLQRLLVAYQHWYAQVGKQSLAEVFEGWLSDPDVQSYLSINRYEDVLWFNKERFDNLVRWLLLLAVFETPVATPTASSSSPASTTGAASTPSAAWLLERLLLAYAMIEKLQKAGDVSGYQIDKLLAALRS